MIYLVHCIKIFMVFPEVLVHKLVFLAIECCGKSHTKIFSWIVVLRHYCLLTGLLMLIRAVAESFCEVYLISFSSVANGMFSFLWWECYFVLECFVVIL